jgi:hypothetical protein
MIHIAEATDAAIRLALTRCWLAVSSAAAQARPIRGDSPRIVELFLPPAHPY